MIEKISILNKRREYLEGNGFTPVDTVTFLNQSITRILIEDENSGFDEREKNIEEIKRFYENTLILTRAYKSVGTNYYNDMDILKLIKAPLKKKSLQLLPSMLREKIQNFPYDVLYILNLVESILLFQEQN